MEIEKDHDEEEQNAEIENVKLTMIPEDLVKDLDEEEEEKA